MAPWASLLLAFAYADAPAVPPPVELAPASSSVTVDDPWTDATRIRRYKWDGKPSVVSKIVNAIILEDPLVPTPLLAPLFDRFPRSEAKKIAESCMSRFREPWDRIGCVSREINGALSDDKYRLPATPCKMHAIAFNRAFGYLGFRFANSMHVDASGPGFPMHVANLVMIQDDHARVFTYVIDSGWFPGVLFPQNDLAIGFHDRNRDGRTDFTRLPEISANPRASYRTGE